MEKKYKCSKCNEGYVQEYTKNNHEQNCKGVEKHEKRKTKRKGML